MCCVGPARAIGPLRGAWFACRIGLTSGSGLAFGQAILEQNLQSRVDLVDIALRFGVALAGDCNRGGGHTVASFVHERVKYDRRQQIRVLGGGLLL